jgi:hypothetical protein
MKSPSPQEPSGLSDGCGGPGLPTPPGALQCQAVLRFTGDPTGPGWVPADLISVLSIASEDGMEATGTEIKLRVRAQQCSLTTEAAQRSSTILAAR